MTDDDNDFHMLDGGATKADDYDDENAGLLQFST